MENTLIFERTFDEAAVISLKGGLLTVGDITITDEHEQDCCERVYADFSAFEHHLKQLNAMGVRRLEIKAVQGTGLVFFFYQHSDYSEPNRVGVLVNCYNEQNGYYSSNLQLVIRIGKSEQKIDVSEVVYDRID